mmetsp:Transcript_12856/g.24549  ORF Transcript_12856/g.24549 Transcript_12856/m.24549 type:complete len:393 (-) Transcript_12856:304-1482(-)
MFKISTAARRLFSRVSKPAWRVAGFASLGIGIGTTVSYAKVARKKETPKEIELYLPTNDEKNYCIFAGNGNPLLANEICMLLGTQLGRSMISKFHDGEIKIRFFDSVRGKKVYVVQSTCNPTNDNLMELLLMISTLRRASADSITAILPYYGYSRQLAPISKTGVRTSLAAADVAIMLRTMGVDQVVSVDLHKDQIEGFFKSDVTVENLDITKAVIPYLQRKELRDPVCVPIGGVKKAKHLRDCLTRAGVETEMGFVFYTGDTGFVNVNEDTHPDETDSTEVMKHSTEFVGDVKDRDVIILTDLIDTGSRVTSAANHLSQCGARRIYAIASHALMTGNAIEVIDKSSLDEVVVFNTIPQKKDSAKIRELTIAPLIAKTISRINTDGSIKALY